MIKYYRNGRSTSQKNFMHGLEEELTQQALEHLSRELHGKASSVVDPETGKHVTVFVRQIGTDRLNLHIDGSPAAASAIEERLGLNKGEVRHMDSATQQQRSVYLAHASEDKPVAKPIAEGLVERGIDVWYDNWEIGYGDSLRRKMEQGLDGCTHFVVLLTETSIAKAWVNEEIDAGLTMAVEEKAKLIGLRHQLALDRLSPFLRTRLTPEFTPGPAGLDELAAQILGVSKKPPLGQSPRYIQVHEKGTTWSMAARVVAEYFVRASEHAGPMDPQTSYEDIQKTTELPMPDVRIGVLDLCNAGLLMRKGYIGGMFNIWPAADLFVTFDAEFMDWDPGKDARDLAVYLHNQANNSFNSEHVAEVLGWSARRFNPAAAYLVGARVVKGLEHTGGNEYWPPTLIVGDELLRFIKNI